jgi:drug/metabolite transporter (DMT)-like permease
MQERIGAQGAGAVFALTAVLFWGSQFPVAKSLFHNLDPYTLTAVRYAAATAAFAALLLALEGRGAFRYGAYGQRAVLLGSVGVSGGVLLVYVGLQHTRAQNAALVVAAQPLLTALYLRVRRGVHLGRATAAATVVAFAGVALVISRGDPSAFVNGSLGWGVFLVLLGQFGWVAYTVESTTFRGWSPLRFTALTAVPGAATVVALAAVAAVLGWARPSAEDVAASPWLLAYAIVGPAVISILAWNQGRALLGAQNVALFQNLVPVTTFTIEIVQGYRPRSVELLGAALTIGALVANNLVQRRRARVVAAPVAV